MVTLLLLSPGCSYTLEFDDTGKDLTTGGDPANDTAGDTAGETTADSENDTGESDSSGETGPDDNHAPSAPTLAITPADPTQLGDLTCTVANPSVDPDGDAVVYAYRWSVDGVDAGLTDATVPDDRTSRGETWTCRVTPSDGALDGAPAEVSVTLGRGYAQLSVGYGHGCGISPDDWGGAGEAACWGNDLYGEGSPPAWPFAEVVAGYYETCGRDATGALTCWGTVSWTMNAPPAGSFVGADLGWYGAYALGADGSLTPWGYADDHAGTFSAVAGGEYDYCALTEAGALDCWGVNPNGEGDPPAGTFTALAAGYHDFCALDTTGAAACWGMNDELHAEPADQLVDLAVDMGTACGIRAVGSLVCWGTDASIVGAVPAGTYRDVAVGSGAACAVDSDGHARCWGSRAAPPPSR